MGHAQLFLLALSVSLPLISAAPHALPQAESLKPIRAALAPITETLQSTTKGVSTGMATGMGGVGSGLAGGLPGGLPGGPRVPIPGTPSATKRQTDAPLNLNLVGVLNTKKPGLGAVEGLAPAAELLKAVEDPENTLDKLPVDGLVKRILSGLGGLGSLLGPLTELGGDKDKKPKPKMPPKMPAKPMESKTPAKTPAGTDPKAPAAEEKPLIPTQPDAADKESIDMAMEDSKGPAPPSANAPNTGPVRTDTTTREGTGPVFQPGAEKTLEEEAADASAVSPTGNTSSDISTDTNIPADVTKTTVWNGPTKTTTTTEPNINRAGQFPGDAADLVKRFLDVLESIPARRVKRTQLGRRVVPVAGGLDPLGQLASRLSQATQTVESARTLTKALPLGLAEKGMGTNM